MADLIVESDLVLFLTSWYRWWLPTRPETICQGVEVVPSEPVGKLPAKVLVIRDDGGPETGYSTGEAAIGLSILAGTRKNPKDANDLARIVHAGIRLLPAAGFTTTLPGTPHNPVNAVLERRRPIAVVEPEDRARRYITATLGVSPEPI